MSTIKLLYVHTFLDRHGRIRRYFRRAGCQRVPLPGLPASKEFMAAYQEALAGKTAPQLEVGASRTKPGSMSALVTAYYRSSGFLQLAEQTKKSYRATIERLRALYGDNPVKLLQSQHVRALINPLTAKPNAANTLLLRIRTLMQFAVENGWRKDDPTVGVRKLRVKTDGYHAWTEAEIHAFEKRWPVGTRERLASDLLLYTGQRSSDVRTMGPQHLVADSIQVRQQKTGTFVEMPVHEALRRSLEACPPTGTTLLTAQNGKPFTRARFGQWFVDAVRQAGLPKGVTAHGLRKAMSRRLAEAGCTVHQIASVTGHVSLKEVERYTRAANKKNLARDAMARITKNEDPV